MTDDSSDSAASAEKANSGETNPGETDALLSRLRVIEDQPLETRAEAFVQIHDRLRSTLEGADAPHASASASPATSPR